MLKRFPDPILMLDDGSILHIELQTANHGKTPNRAGIYALMIAYKDDCRRGRSAGRNGVELLGKIIRRAKRLKGEAQHGADQLEHKFGRLSRMAQEPA